MAISTGYDYGIRKGLTEKGIDNSQINYDTNTGYVTVGGQNFMKPDKLYNGTSYTNQANFDQAWNTYNKPKQTVVNPAAVTTTASNPTQSTAAKPALSYSNVQSNPYTSQTDQIIQQLLNNNKNQPAFDPYASSGYKAAQAQAQRASQANIRAAQEAYGSAGFGRSTALGERAQRIGNDATDYLLTQVVPQLQAQEEARKQQEYNNLIASLTPLLSQQTRADELAYKDLARVNELMAQEQARADALKQQEFANAISQAGVTGTYMPPGSQDIINQLLNVKRQAEAAGAAGATAEDMGKFRSQGDSLRTQLANMGMDVSGLGADVSASNARVPQGVQTLASKGQQFNQDIQNRQFDYQAGRDQVGDQRYDSEFAYKKERDEIGDQQWNKQFSASQDNVAADNARAAEATRVSQLMDIWRNTGVAPAGIPGVEAGTTLANANSKQIANMDEEKRGLVSAIRSGDISPANALMQIEEDQQFGFYTIGQAEELKNIVRSMAKNAPTTQQPQLTKEQSSAMPSETQLDKLYKEQGNGAPELDWKSWYKDPKGRVAGVDFNRWKQLYGPQLRAK